MTITLWHVRRSSSRDLVPIATDLKADHCVAAPDFLELGTSATGSSEYSKSKLAGDKSPTSVEFRTELARAATGRLQKYKLREPFWVG